MSGDVKDQGVEGGSLTAADLDRLAALHEAATPGPWECDTSDRVIDSDVTAGPVRRVNGKYVADWLATFNREDDDASEEQTAEQDAANAALTAAAITALPSLLALARRGLDAEAQYERGYEQGIKERVAEVVRTERERDVLYDATRLSVIGMEVVRSAARMASDKDARVLLKANIETSDKLAAALAEVERVRGRLEKATYFSWRNSAVWIVRPEDSTLWHAYEEVGSCGAALIGKFDTLDAAWSAAEAQAGQAAKQGGEGRA